MVTVMRGWAEFTHRSARLYRGRKALMSALRQVVGTLSGFSAEEYARYKAAETDEIRSVIKGRTVLETGCGPGKEAGRFLDEFGARSVIATDVSFGMLSAARTRCPLVVQADAHHLPFADDSVDVVYSSCMYHHASAHELILAESLRIARRTILIRELAGFQNRFFGVLYTLYYSVFDGSTYRPPVEGWLRFLAPHVVRYLRRPERSLVKRYALFTLDATN